MARLDRPGISEKIVAAITDLAHALDIVVIAEGVETPDQRHVVQTLGCDFIQGFLFSRPLDLDQVAALLDTPGVETFLAPG